MSKAFVKENGHEPEDAEAADAPLPPGGKNYITPAGFARLKAELAQLVEVERPEVVKTVAWAAALGDRSENADYIYGKRRLREIDRRVRFLIKRLEAAEVVNSSGRDTDQVFFGATVKVRSQSAERQVTIVGVDEVDPAHGPRLVDVADREGADQGARGRHRHGARPGGDEELEILEVRYP